MDRTEALQVLRFDASAEDRLEAARVLAEEALEVDYDAVENARASAKSRHETQVYDEILIRLRRTSVLSVDDSDYPVQLLGEACRRLTHEIATYASAAFLALDDKSSVAGENIRKLTEVIDAFRQFGQATRPSSLEETELEGLLAEVAEANSRDLRVLLRGPAPFVVTVDRGLLAIALRNGLVNAEEHPGISAVTITWGVEGGRAFVSLLDDGPGYPAEVLERLALPGVSTKGLARGSGLVNARTAMKSLSGELQLDNHSAGGGRFRVVWPINDDPS